ncbi:MAG TPA: MBL fold metallo-hydrolase [Rhodocyclaceae bacterium]|nr:MBL fold metallo-hydrolase [Rhodocyclaceae bacterium]
MAHFRQFRDPATETFSYVLGCGHSGQTVIIDPVVGQVLLYLGVLKELDLCLTWVLETHLHADHISAADTLREWTGARVAVARNSGIGAADRLLDDGDTLAIGELEIEVLATPGHTPGCLTYRWQDRLFTGDSLLIGSCGRIDEPGSSGIMLFDSVTRRLLSLPAETLVYPGHGQAGRWVSCIGEERDNNPFFHGISRDSFVPLRSAIRERYSPTTESILRANSCCGRPIPAETL